MHFQNYVISTILHKGKESTWDQSLGQEDPLEEGWQPTPTFLPGESLW